MFPLLGGAISPDEYPAMLRAECARLNRAGLTTCSEMAFDPDFGPVLAALHDHLTVRLRTYEVSNPAMSTAAAPGQGDDIVRQVGIKSGSTVRRGSATSRCRSRTWTPRPPAPSA